MNSLLLSSEYLYNTQHILFIVASFIFVAIFVLLLKNNEHKSTILKVLGWLPLLIHVSSFYVTFYANNGTPDFGAFLPFWWCNLMMVLAPIAYSGKKIRTNMAHYVTYGIFLGGVITLFYPTFAGPNIFAWGTFKSFFSHTLMILVGAYAIASGQVVPSMKKYVYFVIGTIVIGLFGGFINWTYVLSGRANPNYMYFDHPPIPELPWLNVWVIAVLLCAVVFGYIAIYEARHLPKEERGLYKTIKKINSKNNKVDLDEDVKIK